IAEKEKVHLVSLLRSAGDAKAKLDGAITKGSQVVQQVQANQNLVQKDIKSAFKVLNKALAMREQALVTKAGEISLGKQVSLAMQGEELKTLRKEILETSEIITKATEAYSPAEMLSAKGAMANKIDQLLKQYQAVSLEPCRSDVIPNMLDTTEVVQHISSFGMVAAGSSPGDAKTDLNIHRAIRGKSRKITVTACDVTGKPFPYGGERVEATLSLLGSQVTGKVIDNRNGTYIATFTPQRTGEHKLRITIDGNHIKGSPFSMYVRQERNYTTLSSVQQSFSLSANPYDIAVENNEVYVAVFGNRCIENFNQNGQRIRTIGNGRVKGVKSSNVVQRSKMVIVGSDGTVGIQFHSPSAISIQGGVLYVVDSGNCCVQKITTTGNAISTFGTRGSGNGQLSNPRGICFDKDGHIFISEGGNNRISVFADNGTFLYHIIGNTADGSNLNAPWGLAIDQCGNLHVANTNAATIKVFTTEGKYVTQYNSGVNQPAGIAIDEEGNIFIADNGYNRKYGYGAPDYQGHSHTQYRRMQSNVVSVLNSKYSIIHSFGAGQNATGITIDKNGFVYVCSSDNCQVYKF
ncbi:MAG: hypothetical protein MJE68_31000, partial [Proteobacteria bacterium]|nr:hypothetical protein [Pseudomonadota bacterium]